MAHDITLFHYVLLAWLQLIFLIYAEAKYLPYDNTTTNVTSEPDYLQCSSSDMSLQKLEAMIIDESGNYIHLKWIQTKGYLANEKLPVWTASVYRDKLDTNDDNKLNMMKDIGCFKMYHDIEKNSAVVYFEKTGTFRGFIGTRYFIEDLPITLLQQCHRVGDKYVKEYHERCLIDSSYSKNSPEVIKSFAECNFSPNVTINFDTSIDEVSTEKNSESHKIHVQNDQDDEQSKNAHVQILVFVAYDITKTYKRLHYDSHLTQIVIDQIMYFNAVDMVFAKLKEHGIELHINLAGIVIENQRGIFNSLFGDPDLAHGETETDSQSDYIGGNIRHHFKNHRSPFSPDSFDLVFYMSSRHLFHNHRMQGITFHGDNLFTMKQSHEPYDTISVTLLKYQYNYNNYYAAAHEVGHSLNVDHDSSDSKRLKNGKQCHGVMQLESLNCLTCIEWSIKSIEKLKTFTGYIEEEK